MRFVWAAGLEKEKNVTLAFQWRSPKDLADVRFSLCAAQAFRVWKNGELVACGPARAAHGCAREDVYRFAETAKGDLFTVEVCAYNVRCLSSVGTGPYFAAEIRSKGRRIAESGDFRAYRLTDRKQRVLRYSFQRAFTESYAMDVCRTALYAGDVSRFPEAEIADVAPRKILGRNVPYPLYGEKVLSRPAERGSIRVNGEYAVWRDRAHDICDTFDGFPLKTLEEDVSAEACAMAFERGRGASRIYRAGEYGVYSFDRTLSGFFKASLSVRSDAVVYLLFDEIDFRAEGERGIGVDFRRNDCCSVVKYALKAGEYRLLSFEPYSARHVRLCVTEGCAEVKSFGMVTYENPGAYRREYAIGDKALDCIFRAAQNTFAQNVLDIPMDCPSRERAGWLCDGLFSGRAELFFTGENRAERNFLENYALSPELKELPRGMLPMCYPGDFPNRDYIPNYALWYIVELHDYARRTGDERLVRLSKKKVYGALGYFTAFENEYGLLENLQGWIFIEWSAANRKDIVRGVNFPSNMTYCRALECAGQLYGDESLLRKSARLKKAIRELSFDGVFFADNALRGKDGALTRTENITETCQYFAFFMGVADKKRDAALYRALYRNFGYFRKPGRYENVHPSNAFIGFVLRLELLRRDKKYARLLREVKYYYLEMAKRTGTLWEHRNVRASLNHGFASYVAVFVAEALGLVSE